MPRLLPALLLLLVTPFVAHAEGLALAPPCDAPPPSATAIDGSPAVGVWNEQSLRKAGWKPPACLNWTSEPTRLAIVLAGDFRVAGSVDNLLARIGAFQSYKSIRYWSVSSHGWQNLASEAGRVGGADLAASDFAAGKSFDYFENGKAGHTVYRLRVLERTPSRVVLASENVTPIRVSLLTAFDPGALQTVTFLDKRGPDVWSYYQIVRAGPGASSLALGSPASYVNRAAALYRYVAGIPTDRDPPLAP